MDKKNIIDLIDRSRSLQRHTDRIMASLSDKELKVLEKRFELDAKIGHLPILEQLRYLRKMRRQRTASQQDQAYHEE